MLSATFDQLAQQYFGSPEGFAKAIKLVQEYKSAERQYPAFEDFQRNFLDRLDDVTNRETELLENAFNYLLASSLLKDSSQPSDTPEWNRKWLEQQLDLFRKAQTTHHGGNLATLTSKPLTIAFKEFLDANRHNWKPNSATEDSFENEVFPLFLELHGDIGTAEIRKDHVTGFKMAVLSLPKNRRKMPEYRDLSIRELADLSVPKHKQLSDRTKSYYLIKLSSFLSWLDTNGYALPNINAPLKRVIKTRTRAQEERNAYSDSDLKRLFNSDSYTKALHRHSFQFWVPLIGLFTGARENEICQLFVEDVCQDEDTGIWVFDFNEKNSEKTKKSLKSHKHARRFPVHPKLVKLGFLVFVAQRKKSRTPRLFPELPYRANKYGDKLQRWFNNTYRKQCRISTPKTSFHSLRHTLINRLRKQLKLQSNEFAHYIGHSPSGNETDQRYTKPLTLKEFERRYRRLKFDHCINFGTIRRWRSQQFSKRT